MMAPLCFVLMPFGKKPDPTGGDPIDFDRVYENGIKPAIEAAGMVAIRADEERTGGIIHKAMFERLLVCDFAIADLTCANANVFYELGVRHAVRPATTVVIFSKRQALPFDVQYVRALPYDLGNGNGFGEAEVAALVTSLTSRLREVKANAGATIADSPLFQLVTDYGGPDIAHLKTDTFRDRAEYAEGRKLALATARDTKNVAALREIEADLGDLAVVELGVLVDLMLSYRAVEAHEEMVALYKKFPKTLQHAVVVREQLAFALKGLEHWNEALRILDGVVAERGPSSETCGLIGSVYKALWDHVRATEPVKAAGHLRNAIDSYVRGFEADIRDTYPGINALTLLDVAGNGRERTAELLPVVEFAAKQRLAANKLSYWNRATMLELAVLRGDANAAGDLVADTVAVATEAWMPKTTARNLRFIRSARVARGQREDWLDQVIRALDPKADLD